MSIFLFRGGIFFLSDGNRVKKTEGGQTVLYISSLFEVNLSTSTNTSYYYLAGTLIAMSVNATLKYVHKDHLGGTSVVTSDNGTLIESLKYYAFGETRSVTGPDVTDKLFTGQIMDDTGLYYYNARYYDPTIGRFISPDTIIPNPAKPQSFNRYAYCLNNPLCFIDPTGNDDVYVLGSNSKLTDKEIEGIDLYNFYLTSAGIWDQKIVLYDEDPELVPIQAADVDPRLQKLTERLERGDLLNIHLIGFSEGAATVGQYLSNLANNPNYVSEGVKSQLRSAYLLECPTGVANLRVSNFNFLNLYKLPERLSKVGINIDLADIWNRASIVHQNFALPGWEGHSYSYDSRSWIQRYNFHPLIGVINVFSQGKYHNDVLRRYVDILRNR